MLTPVSMPSACRRVSRARSLHVASADDGVASVATTPALLGQRRAVIGRALTGRGNCLADLRRQRPQTAAPDDLCVGKLPVSRAAAACSVRLLSTSLAHACSERRQATPLGVASVVCPVDRLWNSPLEFASGVCAWSRPWVEARSSGLGPQSFGGRPSGFARVSRRVPQPLAYLRRLGGLGYDDLGRNMLGRDRSGRRGGFEGGRRCRPDWRRR
jgi:hypothetical protein